MENNIHQKRRPPIEELSKRIHDLEDAHARLKQQMFKFMTTGDRKTSNSISSRKHSALNLTEADYFNILQSIDQPIHISNFKGYVIYRNQAWEKLYGYTASEIRGKSFLDLVIDPKDVPIADDIVQQMLKGECWTGEFPVRNKKGERFVVIGSSKPFRDENGIIIGVISVSAAPRAYQQIRLGVPTRVAPDHDKYSFSGRYNASSSMVNETGPKIDRKPGVCFDSTNGSFCWHWLYGDQEHECGLRMRAKVGNQPWVANTNCVGHDKKALGLWSTLNRSVDCEIKWEDLMIREPIGQGSCTTLYHAVWQGSVGGGLEYDDAMIGISYEKASASKYFALHGFSDFTSAHMHRNRVPSPARGISYLHHCLPPIIHCDLNSSNLLVDKDWTVKVGDFGLCRIKHETYVTRKKGIGKPQWMAPEVLRNEQSADERSDVYSYGVVLWEIVTEKVPWDGLNPMQVMEVVGTMNQGLDIPKDVDAEWASLIQRCLCSEPESRPTFQEILEDLHNLHTRFKFMMPLHEDSRGVRNRKCETDA